MRPKDREPITYDWLQANGFRLLAREERRPTDHVRRHLGGEILPGRPFLASFDDLCIELAYSPERDPSEAFWYCWVVQVEPRRHIHVRHMLERWEVVRLWEGLTGRDWEEAKRT